MTEPPDLASVMKTSTDDMIESLMVCPPPPPSSDGHGASQTQLLNDEAISSLIVPAPEWSKFASALA